MKTVWIIFLVGMLSVVPVTATETHVGKVLGEPNPWVTIVDSERLKIWRRASPTSSIRQVKVDMIVDAPVERVWEVLRDVERYHEFMPYIVEATILREHGDARIVYERISAPFVDDRDPLHFELRCARRSRESSSESNERLSSKPLSVHAGFLTRISSSSPLSANMTETLTPLGITVGR